MTLRDGLVTLKDLDQGCRKSLLNARALMDEAQLLLDAGRPGAREEVQEALEHRGASSAAGNGQGAGPEKGTDGV